MNNYTMKITSCLRELNYDWVFVFQETQTCLPLVWSELIVARILTYTSAKQATAYHYFCAHQFTVLPTSNVPFSSRLPLLNHPHQPSHQLVPRHLMESQLL